MWILDGNLQNQARQKGEMSLSIKCFVCERELTRPGALVFGPPLQEEDLVPKVEKFHLCGYDWMETIKILERMKKNPKKLVALERKHEDLGK